MKIIDSFSSPIKANLDPYRRVSEPLGRHEFTLSSDHKVLAPSRSPSDRHADRGDK